MAIPPELLEPLHWRSIGPPRGGRVVAVAGDPSDRAVFYFGACAGGVWKTEDAGMYWRNVSDGFFRTASVGAIAVSTADPNVVYAGMGESCVRNDVSHGNGVYRSTDAGRTWAHLGLERTRHIARVRVDPRDPDVVFVAALGDIFGPNPERGIFRSTNGGRSWEHVLHRSERAGACDLWLDPSNPRLLYAALWDAQRTPWTMRSGGPDSSLYRSTDGGSSWSEITDHPGLPKGLRGRMGICASPARSTRVWAVIEAADGGSGLYRSEDAGDTWRCISREGGLLGRPWYYSHIVPDPQDPETLYSMNLGFARSTDGGGTWHAISTPHGDNHDLWIDPADPRRMIEGNDGGACVSYNAGESFSTIYNQPTGQIYHVDVDDRFPYRVYGTQQDNSAVSVPSRSHTGSIAWRDCYEVGFSESGHVAVDPKDPDIVYTGAVGSQLGGGGPINRYDHATRQSRLVTIWPEYFFGEDMSDQKHRFQWTFPLVFSPHDPRVLYAGGERVFRSQDDGQSWDTISPDLTRADPEKMAASGGPITKDTSGAEVYCTVFALAESPHEPGLLWAGTDDGRVHVSRDAGASWKEVTPPDLGAWATVAVIEPSPHDPASAYMAAHRYRLQDRAPGLFKTADYGASWQRIHGNLPTGEFTRVIRADPIRPGLLYAGTETTAYVSLDDGGTWQPLASRLPVVPVYDLKLAGNDLVAATHGRGFWILDDVTPLRELPADPVERNKEPAILFVAQSAIRYPTPPGSRRPARGKTYLSGTAMVSRERQDGTRENRFLDAGDNPPDGVGIWYFLREACDDLELTLRDDAGREIAAFHSKEQRDEKAEEQPAEPRRKQRAWEILPGAAGLQRFTWDLRCPGFRALPEKDGSFTTRAGFLVPPGRYEAVLRAGAYETRASFELRGDPRARVSDADLRAQYELLLALRDLQSAVSDGLRHVRRIRAQVEPWTSRRDVAEPIRGDAKAVVEALGEVEKLLTNPQIRHDTDRLKLPVGLDGKLADLQAAVASGDAAPTRGARDVFEKHQGAAQTGFARLEAIGAQDVARLNAALAQAGVPIIDASET